MTKKRLGYPSDYSSFIKIFFDRPLKNNTFQLSATTQERSTRLTIQVTDFSRKPDKHKQNNLSIVFGIILIIIFLIAISLSSYMCYASMNNDKTSN